MLDKSIKYRGILMKRKQYTLFAEHKLPEGYEFVLYKEGDEKDWAEIETSVLEFDTIELALKYFDEEFACCIKEFKRRCIFIEDKSRKKVATLTMWWDYNGLRRHPMIHWFAVKPEYQRLGLGKALVSYAMKQFIKIEGDVDIYLHTQTWSYKAVGIYMKAGFEFTREKGLGGFENNEYDEAISLFNDYLK